MELTNVGPHAISGLVALVVAWLTHKRANRAHKDTIVIDHQQLINETYQQVMRQMRKELERREEAHRIERHSWKKQELLLKGEIQLLQEKVASLEAELALLKAKEEKHVKDATRHNERWEQDT